MFTILLRLPGEETHRAPEPQQFNRLSPLLYKTCPALRGLLPLPQSRLHPQPPPPHHKPAHQDPCTVVHHQHHPIRGHPEDSRVPLVCPLDLNQSCKSNIFGSVNRNSEKTTNMGVFNCSWYHKLEGGSFMLGLLAGIVLTSVILWLYWRRQKRKR